MNLKDFIRSIPDYPKKGILFRDITTLIKDENAFAETINQIIERSKKYIKNLRDVNLDKPLVCKRCFGEKTKRAVKLLSIREKIAPNIRFNVLSYADKK